MKVFALIVIVLLVLVVFALSSTVSYMMGEREGRKKTMKAITTALQSLPYAIAAIDKADDELEAEPEKESENGGEEAAE